MMKRLSSMLKRLFPTLAAMPKEELLIVPLIAFMMVALIVAILGLLLGKSLGGV